MNKDQNLLLELEVQRIVVAREECRLNKVNAEIACFERWGVYVFDF